jgi:siroheme synthase-like protein
MRYFPLFLDIAGKPVLLVGGGEVAARKFTLLASAGAQVTVVSPELGTEMSEAVARGACQHLPREFEVIERHEQPVAMKKVTATEEVEVHKDVRERTETVSDVVRETKVDVEKKPASR